MILGLGTEIVEVLRIGRMIEKYGERFLEQVYTPREMGHCQARREYLQYFARVWSAKQAVCRALAMPTANRWHWTAVEIDCESPVPQVTLSKSLEARARELGVAQIMLSFAHCRTHAVATAIALAEPRR